MKDARRLRTINVGLFEQTGGWVFVVTDKDFYSTPIASGKRKTLALAMEAGKQAAAGYPVTFSRIDNVIYDWTTL